MIYLSNNQSIIKNYCHACDVGLCCAKEAENKRIRPGHRGQRLASHIVSLFGAVPGPDFFTDSR